MRQKQAGVIAGIGRGRLFICRGQSRQKRVVLIMPFEEQMICRMPGLSGLSRQYDRA